MAYFVGLGVSVQETAVCVVDEVGKVICERKVPTEPDDIAVLLTSVGGDYVRVGIEAGPLSQWLVNGLTEPPRVYRRVKLSKDGPYDTEKTYPDLHV